VVVEQDVVGVVVGLVACDVLVDEGEPPLEVREQGREVEGLASLEPRPVAGA
jgi:hypothetical protein